jgi:hypothetical protein
VPSVFGLHAALRLKEMLAIILIIIACFYAVLGVVTLMPLCLYLVVIPKSDLLTDYSLLYVGSRLLMFMPSLFLAYGLLRFKRWSRYLLMAYNVCWLMYLIFAFFIGETFDAKTISLPVGTVLGVIVIALSGLTLLFLREEVKDILTN